MSVLPSGLGGQVAQPISAGASGVAGDTSSQLLQLLQSVLGSQNVPRVQPFEPQESDAGGSADLDSLLQALTGQLGFGNTGSRPRPKQTLFGAALSGVLGPRPGELGPELGALGPLAGLLGK